MPLLSARNIHHAFGGPPVLDGAELRVESGDRVCLFGRNGEGKTTLLRILRGELVPDEGSVDIQRGAVLSSLEQTVPPAHEATVEEVVAGGLGEVSDRLADYRAAVRRVTDDPTDKAMGALARAETALEAVDGWEVHERMATVLSRLDLDPSASFAALSGGWRRRAFLAAALVRQPDVLLLDEPTNHLDIAAIEWLEDWLANRSGAVIFVTHDRAFLRNVATRIVELDRGRLREYPGDFDAYLDAKAHELEVEEAHAAEFDKKLAREEAWLRKGVKARRTRNEGRVRALQRMREQRRRRRERKGPAKMTVQTAERSGEEVFRVDGLRFAYDDARIVDGLDLTVRRGDRLGLIGPNGVGKTTLIRLFLGELEPDEGQVRQGTRLQVRYYDQLRDELDDDATVAETIVDRGDQVEVDGQRRHIISYLKDFLFEPDQARVPVRVLSGGERNRLLLAKLFSQPANVLVLDEPTNDLDLETLELLEERLLAFPGTILLVSHDREFLDNVATESLVFLGDGRIERVIGGYDGWERVRGESRAAAEPPSTEPRAEAEPDGDDQGTEAEQARPARTRGLPSWEQRELDALPGQIEELEREQAALYEKLADPSLYEGGDEAAAGVRERLEEVGDALEQAFSRWEELESKRG